MSTTSAVAIPECCLSGHQASEEASNYDSVICTAIYIMDDRTFQTYQYLDPQLLSIRSHLQIEHICLPLFNCPPYLMVEIL